jgi:hypothetical protein
MTGQNVLMEKAPTILAPHPHTAPSMNQKPQSTVRIVVCGLLPERTSPRTAWQKNRNRSR